MDPEELGLGLGSGLLNSLKQMVVTLASNAGVLNTVQSAAQAVLQSGWSVLLPTAEERARALSSLLPNTGKTYLPLFKAHEAQNMILIISNLDIFY